MRHCRYCGNTGHNRRTCPSRSPESKDSDKQYHNRYRAKNRRCSFCYETGHDRRKCAKLVVERNTWINNNAIYREQFFEDMKRNGLGIGALVKRKDIYSSNMIEYFVVKNIDWGAINHDDTYSYPVHVAPIADMENPHNLPAPLYGLRGEALDQAKRWRNAGLEVEVPVAENTIKPPAEWFTGKSHGLPRNLR